MRACSKWFHSSVGCKFMMAVSAIGMVGFLCGHLGGNLLVFAGPDTLNQYAAGLRDMLPLLWVLRVGTLASLLVHICAAVRLTRINGRAKPMGYHRSGYRKTTYAARSMRMTGLIILSFVLYHLAHLTFRWTHPEFAGLGPYDVYQMLILSFQSLYLVLFYSVAVVLLMKHLSHGLTGMFQSLGLAHGKYQSWICGVGPMVSSLLGVGFLSIPWSIFLGLVH